MEIGLLPAQKRLLQSNKKRVLMLGGIGTGKTHTLALQAIVWATEFPKSKFMICANTYTQLMNATVPAIVEVLEEHNIPYELVKSTTDKRLVIMGAKFYLYSLQNYEVIRGIQVGGILADEVCFAKKEAFDVIMGRLRDKNGPLKFRGFSSPNGFTWTYDIWGNIPVVTNRELIQAKTSDNIFLPEGYYEDLLEQYGGPDNPLAKQELMGEFVNLTAGSIYWAFNREKHVRPCEYIKGYPIYVGQDWNVEAMSGVCVQWINGIFYVFKENINYDSNSYETAVQLKTELAGKPFMVIPDSTGNARKTSAPRGTTDIQIFKDLGIHVMPTHNPLIVNRQNTVNMKLQKGQLVIDPSCKELIREIETLSNRDKEGLVSHAAVALGYVIWKLDPLRLKKRKSYSTTR